MSQADISSQLRPGSPKYHNHNMGFYDEHEQLLRHLSDEIHMHVIKVRQLILESKPSLASAAIPPTPEATKTSLTEDCGGPLPLSPASAQRWVTDGTRPSFPKGKPLAPSVGQRPTRRIPLEAAQIPRFPGFGAFLVDDDDMQDTSDPSELEADAAIGSSISDN